MTSDEPRGSDVTKLKSSNTAGLTAWAFFDWANSAFPTVVQTFVFAAYFTSSIAVDEKTGAGQWGLAVAASGLVIAIGGPLLGAIADRAGKLKPWVAGFTLLCAVPTALLWFATPSAHNVWPALALMGLATLGAEFAELFYNAMLPGLAPRERIGRWSGWAWGLGYAGGLTCLLVVLFAFVGDQAWFNLDRSTAEHVRIAFPFVAVWMILFALPLLSITPDPGGPGEPLLQAARAGLRQLVESCRNIRRYRGIVRFLIARMIFADGLATLFSFGGVYAAAEFALDEAGVLKFGILLNVTAGLGAAGFAWIDDRIGGKRTILLSLVGLILAGAAVLLVHDPRLFWISGACLGIFVGPVQAAGRSYLARVTPVEIRVQTYGLYALSGRATAFAGPLAVGWITYATGSTRLGMSVILVLFAVGFMLMWTAPTDKPGATESTATVS